MKLPELKESVRVLDPMMALMPSGGDHIIRAFKQASLECYDGLFAPAPDTDAGIAEDP